MYWVLTWVDLGVKGHVVIGLTLVAIMFEDDMI